MQHFGQSTIASYALKTPRFETLFSRSAPRPHELQLPLEFDQDLQSDV